MRLRDRVAAAALGIASGIGAWMSDRMAIAEVKAVDDS